MGNIGNVQRICPHCKKKMALVTNPDPYQNGINYDLWWRECTYGSNSADVVCSELDRRHFLAMLEWVRTGEPALIAHNKEIWWSPVHGYSGDLSFIGIMFHKWKGYHGTR
jgi:hypothetical protein